MASTEARLKWDDREMRSSYANVCNIASTRDEVVLMFGVNQAWHAGQKEVPVELADRIILSPYAAKRLAALMAGIVRQYEERFGAIEGGPRAGGTG